MSTVIWMTMCQEHNKESALNIHCEVRQSPEMDGNTNGTDEDVSVDNSGKHQPGRLKHYLFVLTGL